MAPEESFSPTGEKGAGRLGDGRPEGSAPEGGGPDDSRLEELLGRYLDRLNSGEKLDALQILAAEPVLGPEILKGLRAFVDLEAGEGTWGAGRNLGDFTIRRQIGRGGMAVVYDAWQNSMDRRVALKVLPPGIAADDRAFGRFMREASTAGKLNHENIVSVYAMGVNQSTPYFAMEFVEGETLAAILARRRAARGKGKKEAILGSMSPLPGSGRAPETMEDPQTRDKGKATEDSAAQAPLGRVDLDLRFCIDLAHWFAGAADGLQHAHSSGVIHRDIKPSNLIVERGRHQEGSGCGRLRILDFGLARLEGQESFTASGDFVGTPLYMSPEQARRRKIGVDHRTDIYSLGATLYEMLTLRPPFQGKDHQETLSRIIEKDPVPPRKMNPRIPRDLETIVLKCLRKDPWDRYGTAEALAQDLRRFARGDPIEARPQSPWARVSSGVRRRKMRFLALVTVPLVLFAVVWLAYEKKQAEDEAKLAGYRPALQRVLERIYASPFTLEAAFGPPDEPARSFKFAGLSPAFLGLGLAQTPRHLSPLAPEVFRGLRGPGDSNLEEPVTELAAVAELLPLEKDAHYHLARAYSLLGRPEDAKEEIERTLRCDPDFVPAKVLRSEALGDANRLGVRRPGQGKLEAIWTQYEGKSDWRGPWTRAYRALSERAWARAVEACTRLIALRGEEEPYTGCFREAYLGRGVAYLEARDYRLAREDFARAEALAGGIEAVLLLAKACYQDGDRELAERKFEESWKGAKRDERRDAALWVAAVYFSLGDLDKALAWADRLGESPIRFRLRSLFLYLLGSTKEAIDAGREAVDRNSGDPLACRLLASAILKELWARFGQELGREPSHGSEARAGEAEGEGLVPVLMELIDVVRRCQGVAPEGECEWARSLVSAARDAVDFYLRYVSRREAMSARKKMLAAISAAVLTLGAGEAVKALDVCDDWTQGDQDPFDGTPVAWMANACCPGRWTPAVDGNGIDVINTTGAVALLMMQQAFGGNVAIRLTASFNGPRTPYPGTDFWWKYAHAPCISVNLHENGGNFYVGELYSDGTVDVFKWTGGMGGAPGSPVIGSLGFDPTVGDLEIELASTPRDVQLRVWPVGEERPASPQVTLQDTELRWGHSGVSYTDPNDHLPGRLYSACLMPLDDETPPQIFCPGEVTVEANTGCSHEGLIDGISATDDRSPSGSITIAYEPETIPLGTSTVTVTATDEAGNSSSCTMTVHVLDATPPEVTCPTSLTVECASAEGAKVDFEAVVADGCDPAPTATFSPTSGSIFPPGTTTVTCVAADAAGNTSTCTFEVTVACGGLQIPGDSNGDGKLDISDPVSLLGFLFLGQSTLLPCGDGSLQGPGGSGNLTLLDSNGDGGVDLSDAVYVLGHLFLGGPAPALGNECVAVAGCPENPRCAP